MQLTGEYISTLGVFFKHFGNKPFMLFQAPSFPPYVTLHSYDEEENMFKKFVYMMRTDTVPTGATIISSLLIYKVKIDDDKFLKLKSTFFLTETRTA